MPKKIIHIRGMHCKSCEILVESNLKKITGVKSAIVNHRTGVAEISFEGKDISEAAISDAIKQSGYTLGEKDKLSWFSRDAQDYKNLFVAAIVLFVLYGLAKWLGIIGIDANMEKGGFLVALVVGLIAGISTCMALVGGLILALSARHAELHPEATAKEKFRPHLYFNFGRVIGFAFFGGIIGLLGSAFKPSPNFLGAMTIVIGAVMIFLGLKLVEIFPILRNKTISLPKGISKFFGLHKENREYSHKGAVITGALTFFLPCGFTQAMQLYAVGTGSFWGGAVIMFLFALGTAPGLLGIGGLSSVFKGRKARIFFATAGLAVILLGWYNIANGSRLISGGQSAGSGVTSGQVQEVRMTEKSNGYEPNVLTVKAGQSVKWIINATAPFSCAASIVVPSYGINKQLQSGENIIEFTPKQAGEIPFSCSMGMYRGKFIVTDDAGTAVPASVNNSSLGSAGGSCGAGGGCGGCGGGGGIKFVPQAGATNSNQDAQIIKAVYTYDKDIQPNTFTVKAGQPVQFEIDVKENGYGCMSTIMIPGLYNNAQYLRQGNKIIMDFTPSTPGDYQITCAMGVTRGTLKVI